MLPIQPRESSSGGASLAPAPQAPLAGVPNEPDVPGFPAAVTHDPVERGCPRLANRAPMVSISADRPALPRDFAGTVAYAGVDPTSEGRDLQDPLRAVIATRGGYCWWDVDHAGCKCVVVLSWPGEQTFSR